MELPEATKIRLKFQYPIIAELVNKLTEEQCHQEVFPGKWTIHQQLAHLVRYQQVFFERVETIMSTFNAVFQPYVAEEDPEFQQVAKLSLSDLMTNLHQMRQTINGFYFNLNSGELIRKGRHTELGNFSVALWAEFFLLHEAHHIFQIFRMCNMINNEPPKGAKVGM
jgi:uncharacterized damage-inducible protein DinB